MAKTNFKFVVYVKLNQLPVQITFNPYSFSLKKIYKTTYLQPLEPSKMIPTYLDVKILTLCLLRKSLSCAWDNKDDISFNLSFSTLFTSSKIVKKTMLIVLLNHPNIER